MSPPAVAARAGISPCWDGLWLGGVTNLLPDCNSVVGWGETAPVVGLEMGGKLGFSPRTAGTGSTSSALRGQDAMNFESQARSLLDEALPFTVGSGGPLVAVPAEVAGEWGRGSDVGIYGTHRDYDRACHPRDWMPTEFRGLGWVEVGGAIALALELDCYTQFLRLSPLEGVLYRAGRDQVTEGDIRSTLGRVDQRTWQQLPRPFSLATGRFFSFDAAFAGATSLAEFEGGAFAMECELAPGQYDVFVAAVDGIDLIKLVAQIP